MQTFDTIHDNYGLDVKDSISAFLWPLRIMLGMLIATDIFCFVLAVIAKSTRSYTISIEPELLKRFLAQAY